MGGSEAIIPTCPFACELPACLGGLSCDHLAAHHRDEVTGRRHTVPPTHLHSTKGRGSESKGNDKIGVCTKVEKGQYRLIWNRDVLYLVYLGCKL